MLIPVLLFLVGFGLLIKGGDWFVDGSVGIARRFHLPELLIGATIVSIGTTLPEVMVSSQAAMQGNAGISYGNAIGSVICNTSLIAAITISVSPGKSIPDPLLCPPPSSSPRRFPMRWWPGQRAASSAGSGFATWRCSCCTWSSPRCR